MATLPLKALRKSKPLAHIQLVTSDAAVPFFSSLRVVDSVSSTPAPDFTHFVDLDDAYESYLRSGIWKHPVHAYAERLEVDVPIDFYELPDTSHLRGWAQTFLPPVANRAIVALAMRSRYRSMASWTERKWVELCRLNPTIRFVLIDADPRPNLEVRGEPLTTSRLWDEPNVLDMTGRTPTLLHALALIRECHACVTVDTATAHLASALDLPTLVLFGGAAGWARAPFAGNVQIVQGVASCYPCRSVGTCLRDDGRHCLDPIEADFISRKLTEMLATTNPAPIAPPL
jgi:hypothetical protein